MKPIERNKLIIDPGVHTIASGDAGPVVMKGDVFTGIEKGTLPGQLRFEGFTPKDPSKEVEVTYKAAKDIELGQLRLDSKDRLLFVPGPGKGACVTTPKVALSNPSATVNPPNGPEGGKNPLTNQFAYFNVPGWWDDSCCGEIDVTVMLKDGTVLSTRDNVKSQRTRARGIRMAGRGSSLRRPSSHPTCTTWCRFWIASTRPSPKPTLRPAEDELLPRRVSSFRQGGELRLGERRRRGGHAGNQGRRPWSEAGG